MHQNTSGASPSLKLNHMVSNTYSVDPEGIAIPNFPDGV